jgi:dipeptidyl aminopeptidase/acylaminoacyl peptidase
MLRPKLIINISIIALVFSAPLASAEEIETAQSTVESWMVFGPVPYPVPAFGEEDEAADTRKAVLAAKPFGEIFWMPEAGTIVDWFGSEASWRVLETNEDGVVELKAPADIGERQLAVAWFAASLRADRYSEVELEVESKHPVEIYLDGEKIGGGGGDSLTLSLEPGGHTLVVKTVLDASIDASWTINASLTGDRLQSLSLTTDPERDLAILDVLDAAAVTGFDLSPSGDRVALTVARVRPGTDESETWVELRATDDGRRMASWRGAPAMSQVEFAPTGNGISYVTKGAAEGTSTLWLADLETGATRALVEGVENFGGYEWAPTGDAVVYSATDEAEKDERGIKHLRGLLDRMAGNRDLTSLYLLRVADGVTRRLTAGTLSSSAEAFSPDGARLLVRRQTEDLSRRPYSRDELWELDLLKGGARKLRDFQWLSGVEYAPTGQRLVVLAGPSEFGDSGIAAGTEQPVNDFDGQLFIWDPESDDVEAISRGFGPSVSRAVWSRHDGAIYAGTIDGEFGRIYRYSPESGEFTALAVGIESVSSFDLADTGPTIVAAGTSVWQAQKVVVLDQWSASPHVVVDPASERFAQVRQGEVKGWDHAASDGWTVHGRVYYPVGFDSGKTYPAIVNYYGGTSPIGRSFGGRYPAEWWAANGYVVYVVIPTGAYGWGQEASTVHVNDWGAVTSRQIIEATTAFLEAHPFVDRDRVGCIGASYGGFMTMVLITKTDLFTAAVAHAGISALSSYWGEGYWGYSYGAVANAESFPWNRRDLFVDQSPLFNADNVTTPLLLTHGDEDPNVPPGESDQFYAALKLLGVPVEYLRVAGLGHLIMEHDKRELWSKSIVAWFDKWLKDQPQWWNALYPEP